MILYLFKGNELSQEEIEQIRIFIEDNYQVANTRLIKETSHSLVFEGMKNDSLVGFVYQKETGAVIEDEDYRIFL